MSYLVVDLETTGLSWPTDDLHGIGVVGPTGRAVYYAAEALPSEVRTQLANNALPKVGHNLRFDWRFLAAKGFAIDGDFYCTRIAAHLLDENSPVGLKPLAARYLAPGALQGKSELDEVCEAVGAAHVGELCEMDLALPDRPFFDLIARYCCEDVENTRALFELFRGRLKEAEAKVAQVLGSPKGPLTYYLEEAMPAEKALLAIELPGIRLDEARIRAYGAELAIEREQRLAELAALSAAHTSALDAEAEAEMRAFYAAKADAARAKIRPLKENPTKKAQARHAAKLANVDRRYDALFTAAAAKAPRFNWSSPAQVGRLFERLGYTLPRTKTGQPKTDEATLQGLLREPAGKGEPRVVEGLLSLRATEKLIGTYVEGLLSRAIGGRIYAEYTPWPVTGRLASENPNMQNIPRSSPVKRALRPDAPAGEPAGQDDYVFIYGDYSQVELRIAAHLSRDPVMLEWFNAGVDPHSQAAEKMFGTLTPEGRQVAKRTNFLTIYDGGAFRLEETLRQEGQRNAEGAAYSREECKAMLDAWWADHRPYRAHLDALLTGVKRHGALVAENGRVRRIPDIVYGNYIDWRTRRFTGPADLVEKLRVFPGEQLSSKELLERASKRYSHAKKQAYNFPVQSVGASITKAAIVALQAQGFVVRTTVHDSIVVQVRRSLAAEAAKQVRTVMEGAYTLSVPLKVDIKILESLDESDKAVLFSS